MGVGACACILLYECPPVCMLKYGETRSARRALPVQFWLSFRPASFQAPTVKATVAVLDFRATTVKPARPIAHLHWFEGSWLAPSSMEVFKNCIFLIFDITFSKKN